MSAAERPTGYGSKDQIARLLALIPYLHLHGEVRLADAAAMLEVSESQVTKDLKVLWMCGLPGGLPDDLIDVDIEALEEPGGDRIIRVNNADYLTRPLRLTPVEATALIVALRALRDAADEATRTNIDSALGKLERAAADVAPLVHVDAAADRAAEHQSVLAEAIAAGRQVSLRYFVPSRDEESVRVVDPHRLTRAHGAVYLDGWCHLAGSPRWFRLDRIQSAEILPTAVTTPGPADTEEMASDHSAEATLVTVVLAPEAAWLAEYYNVAEIRRTGGGLEVDIPVFDPRWLIRLLMRVSPYAHVLAPAEYAELHRATIEKTAALYR